MLQYPVYMQPTLARIEQISPDEEEATAAAAISHRFPVVPYKVARNFLVTDTYMDSPVGLQQMAAAPGDRSSDPSAFLSAHDGLGAVPDDIKDLLPPECRAAFDGALEKEAAWKKQWGTENEQSARRLPIIDKAIVPYSMSS